MGKLISQLTSTNTFSDSDKLAIEQVNQTVQMTLGQLKENINDDGNITPAKLSEGAPSWDANGVHTFPSLGFNGNSSLILNYGINGDGQSFIDFHSTSTTNNNYDARIIKDPGINSDFRLENKNSGNTTIHQDDKIKFITARGRDGYTTVSGGGVDATDGTKMKLYGSLHATKSDQIEYQANQHILCNSAGTPFMEIGKTGNLQPYIDFHGTDTDGEYSSRIWRKDNGTFEITQAGDNPLALTTYGTSDGTLRGANIELYSKSNEAHPGYAYYDADRHIFRNADGNSPFMVLDLDTSAEISNDHGEFKFYPWEYRVENDDASTYIGNYNGENTSRGFSAIINNKTGTDRGGLFIGVTDDNGDEYAIMCFNQILEGNIKTNGRSGEIFSVRTNGNVTAAGNLLVGTTATNPASSYDSSNPDGVSLLGNKIEVSRSGGGAPFDVNRGEDGSVAVMRHKGIIVGNIAVTSSSMSFNNTSDYRLKEDIVEMKGSLDRLKALKPCNFKWKSNGTRVDGFIAHEAQYVVPEAVTGTKDAVDAEGKPEYQGIDQAKLVPLLTKALQEAVAKIEALEARVTALEYK